MIPSLGTPTAHVQPRRATRAANAAGVITAAIGVFVLVGWIFDVHSLKTIYGPITMKTNAAIGLVLCGSALAGWRRAPAAAFGAAAAAAALGAVTLFQHLTGSNLGIDQLLFTEPAGAAGTASPNCMGLTASTTFLLAGVSLCLLIRGGARGAGIAQRLTMGAVGLAAIPIAGYLYGAEELYGLARYTGIALHTALAFIVLHAGILLTRAEVRPVAVFLDDGPAGTVLRRLAVPVAAIPLALGYLQVLARDAQLVDRGLGTSLYAISLITVLTLTVWYTAQAIERSDQARRQAERERDALMLNERQARSEAERANALKDRFLATLSHELRTPLNVVLGWTHILERNPRAVDHVRIAGLVARNGRLLARLVEDLLDVSRVTTGQFEISREPVSVNVVVANALDAIRPSAEERQLTLTSHLDEHVGVVDADVQRLQQIVLNLLSNAVKFTPPGGRIRVRTDRAEGAAVVSVDDSGIGFAKSFEHELFTPFRQADSSDRREHGGLGLGMSIAKHLAELHHGTLTGTSPGIGQGATFTLTLPDLNGGAATSADRSGRHATPAPATPPPPAQER